MRSCVQSEVIIGAGHVTAHKNVPVPTYRTWGLHSTFITALLSSFSIFKVLLKDTHGLYARQIVKVHASLKYSLRYMFPELRSIVNAVLQVLSCWQHYCLVWDVDSVNHQCTANPPINMSGQLRTPPRPLARLAVVQMA
jgi:hypothetical protein